MNTSIIEHGWDVSTNISINIEGFDFTIYRNKDTGKHLNGKPYPTTAKPWRDTGWVATKGTAQGVPHAIVYVAPDRYIRVPHG
jgi:hypothetical protein